ncbi:CMP-N-acetylneuraminate-poly-alpha-2,8-sialyltransferase-like [Antedon mediterranea]|uniref:CMP-N-acetylneuraminate-poly-alpha-2, 8-sialyltransferase-like n=1 Tax=Antedon mediterranea TaxID=105859 RepID=UPI003AF55608
MSVWKPSFTYRPVDCCCVVAHKTKEFNSSVLIPFIQRGKYSNLLQFRKATHFYKYLQKKGKTISRHRTCAVVGNGGILLNSGCGSEIDAHDFVMRSNMAPIKEFVNDVGHKTNIMSANQESMAFFQRCITNNSICDPRFNLERLREFKNVILWFSKESRPHTTKHFELIHYFDTANLDISIAYPFTRLADNLQRFWNIKDKISSGLYLYTAAVQFCDMISLYGFYPFGIAPDGRKIKFHYDGKSRFSFNNSHKMPSEYKKLIEMKKEKYLRMVTNKCVLQRQSFNQNGIIFDA